MSGEVVEFFSDDHSYEISGRKVPSVTGAIRAHFPLTIPPERLEFARQMGIAIHKATELLDLGELDWSSVDSRIVPHVEAWESFKKQTGCAIVDVERVVWHSALRYAGTCDRIIKDYDGVYAVVDIKKPVLDPLVGVQLAAYMEAFNHGRERDEFKITRRYGVQLRADGTYRLRMYKEKTDFSIFVSCLNITHWRERHGL